MDKRREAMSLRNLTSHSNLIDFSSNDYLGFAGSDKIFDKANAYLNEANLKQNGATGSRLLTGNHRLYSNLEKMLCRYHKSESALIFNSGYNANVGFFSSVPQRNDVILFDANVHASIREGILLSRAKAYKFEHNSIDDLNRKLRLVRHNNKTFTQAEEVYVITESVFSMDGDTPDLKAVLKICNQHKALLVVDEAHAVGVFGHKGEGCVPYLGLEHEVFARIITFGKALGSHGAAILGSTSLSQYLINFARSFIYTTALAPHTLATTIIAYKELEYTDETAKLKVLIAQFKDQIKMLELDNFFIVSNSTIQSCIIPGNKRVKSVAQEIQNAGFDVRPILSPTVKKGKERLRFCLHSYNTENEIKAILKQLANHIL